MRYASPIDRTVSQAVARVLESLPEGVRLVAVSKTHPVEAIRSAYDAGQRVFGENRVQEIARKAPLLPHDIEWHLIGQLQRNKVRQVLPLVRMIHSVDSERLLSCIDAECARAGITMDCLLQVRIAREETKSGFAAHEVEPLLAAYGGGAYAHVRIRGLMGMATFSESEELVRGEFTSLWQLYERLRREVGLGVRAPLDTLSMGMSGDYQLAIGCGSNMVRVGSAIFGQRTYPGAESALPQAKT